MEEGILRLILAAAFGGLIGMEREFSHRPAGLRTHILVALGAALITQISMTAFSGGDPARLAAQVVSGIGFLGAGTILRHGNEVRGLTTAASLWVSGGIGIAVGAGEYVLASATVAIVLFSLILLGFFQRRAVTRHFKKLTLSCRERSGLIRDIGNVLAEHNIIIRGLNIERSDEAGEDDSVRYHMVLLPPSELDYRRVVEELRDIDGMQGIEGEF